MGVWYRAGTVAVTSGSKTVTGTGTQWQNLIFGVAPGVTFYGPDGKPYEIDTVNSNTSLTLATNYSGATASGQAYAIDPTRSGSVASLAAQTSEVLKFSQGQFTQIQNWFTGAASADVTLTSPAGQTITVPSYSKVTSEGEGQAARAKTEADKAAASAALASDIVVASALPLPDVWAPLSDSLRLLTGFGRDVLVGSDVVARMVNFSRSTTATYIGKDGRLKTAAANEPRFEKEGLLIEGQSTNLFLNSENVAVWSNPPAGPVPTRELQAVQGGLVTCKVTGTSVNSGVRQTYTSTAGGVHTVSFYLSKNSQSLKFLLENGGAAWGMGAQAVIDPATGTMTEVISITSAKSIPFLDGYIYQLTLPAGKAGGILNAEWRLNAAGDFYIGMPQLEALPFASSYIPTSGAAVTRAADVATLPQSLNLGESQLGFSLAVEFDSINPDGYRVFDLSDLSGVLATGPSVVVRHAGKAVSGVQAPLGQRHHLAYTVGADGTITVAMNGKIVAVQQTAPGSSSNKAAIVLGNLWNGGNARPLYGHLRDLKIWTKKPLTADQLKVASA